MTECTGGKRDRASDPWTAFANDGTALFLSLVLDPAKPILHVAGALRLDRYNGRESVRLQIDDAASAAGLVSAH